MQRTEFVAPAPAVLDREGGLSWRSRPGEHVIGAVAAVMRLARWVEDAIPADIRIRAAGVEQLAAVVAPAPAILHLHGFRQRCDGIAAQDVIAASLLSMRA